ncbi:tafazzin-like [Oppia nitens]|uniref:tafazzin-like n=1 Tax=Oppia nitens TaxID=1686743 RepID=UPI0023DB0289|nr:tafazzin-like [Oppia nitens]
MSSVEWPSLLSRLIAKEVNFKWRLGSKVIVPTVGLISKLWMQCLNSSHVQNRVVLLDTLAKHYKNKDKRPLITISNHSSCLDDPLIWGVLIPMKWQLNAGRHRWSAAAQEICFTNVLYSMFFAMGKTFPIIRGKGLYQPAMDYALNLLKDGQWIHFFPEGKVVMRNKEIDSLRSPRLETHVNVSEDIDCEVKPSYDLKWGLARLLLDHVFNDNTYPEVEVLPFYHLGMDDILPTQEPYIPRVNKRTTFYIREDGPIVVNRNFLSELMDDISSLSSKDKRIKIMRFFESEMNSLKVKAIEIHNNLENIVNIKH